LISSVNAVSRAARAKVNRLGWLLASATHSASQAVENEEDEVIEHMPGKYHKLLSPTFSFFFFIFFAMTKTAHPSFSL